MKISNISNSAFKGTIRLVGGDKNEFYWSAYRPLSKSTNKNFQNTLQKKGLDDVFNSVVLDTKDIDAISPTKIAYYLPEVSHNTTAALNFKNNLSGEAYNAILAAYNAAKGNNIVDVEVNLDLYQ